MMQLKNIEIGTVCNLKGELTLNFDIVYSSSKVDMVTLTLDMDGNIVKNDMVMVSVNKGIDSDYVEYEEVCNRLNAFEGEDAKSLVNSVMSITKKYDGLRDKLKAKHLYKPTYDDCRALLSEIIVCNSVLHTLKSQNKVNEMRERIALLKEALKLKESKIDIFYEELSVLDKEENIEMSKIVIGL